MTVRTGLLSQLRAGRKWRREQRGSSLINSLLVVKPPAWPASAASHGVDHKVRRPLSRGAASSSRPPSCSRSVAEALVHRDSPARNRQSKSYGQRGSSVRNQEYNSGFVRVNGAAHLASRHRTSWCYSH